MQKKVFRWGIIGPGRIAHRFAQGIKAAVDAELYAVASRDVARSRVFARNYGAEKAYASYVDLLEDSKVDAVYIATPHCFHFDQALMALEAGKPVLCEKPLTVNAAQTRILMKTANLKGVFLMEALWTRFLPIYEDVRRWLEGGSIGRPQLLTSTFGFRAPLNYEDRLYNADLAGGALLDIGVYNLAITQWVLGRNAQYFSAHSHIGKTGVDELTSVDLFYEDGTASQFTCTIKADTENDFNIYGEEGRIRIHPPFWDATKATLTSKNESLTVEKPYIETGFEYEIEEAMRCIRLGEIESPKMTHAQTLATMTLMDKIRTAIGLKYPFE
ncbi:Gfo/Idh/MocA family oxidoreductase [bacterium]|nr:Gfo/Idh/MocA family oxidoreductase [bacterium]